MDGDREYQGGFHAAQVAGIFDAEFGDVNRAATFRKSKHRMVHDF